MRKMWGGAAIAFAGLMCISGCKNPFSDSKKSDIQHAYVPITERVEEKAFRSKTSKSVFNLYTP